MASIIAKILILTSTLLFVVSCGSLNSFLYKDKCTAGNWSAVGEADGTKGKYNFTDWQGRCQEYGAKPDLKQYDEGYVRGAMDFCFNSAKVNGNSGTAMAASTACLKPQLRESYSKGYKDGLAEFCTKATALKAGTTMNAYNPEFCPKEQRKSLLEAYTNAKSLGVKKTQVSALEKEIEEIQAKVYDITIPEDAKKHYRSLLESKRAELKKVEREVYSLEAA